MEHKGQKSFIQSFLTLGVGTLIYMIVGIIGTPIVTRLVDPADYGQMSILSVYSSIGLMLCGLGLDQTLLRYFYRDDIQYKRKLVHICCGIPLLAAAVVSILLLIAWGAGFQWVTLTELLLLEVNVFALLLSRFATLLLRLRYHTRVYSTVNIIQKSAYILFTVLLVCFTDLPHFIALAVSTISGTFVAAAVAVAFEAELWKPSDKEYRFPVKTGELMKYGFPIMLASSINVVFAALDKLFIQHFCTLEDVGIYTSAMNLVAIFSIVRTSFNTIWMPAAVDHYEKNPEDKSFYRKGNTFISILMLCFGAAVVLLKDLFVLLLGSKYQDAAMIVPFLMLEPIMYTISETTATGIVVQKKSSYQVIVAAGSCIVNFFGNWLLTPIMGPQGAALSTGISYIVFFILRTGLSNRVFRVDYALPRFAVSVAALFAFAVYGSNHDFGWGTAALFFCVIAVIGVCYRKDIPALIKTAANAFAAQKKGRDTRKTQS